MYVALALTRPVVGPDLFSLTQSQVYSQVQTLFKDAPDLLAEFKKFLPNAIPASPGPNGMAPLPQTGLGYAGTTYAPDDSPPNHAAKKPPSKRSRKRVPEKEATPVPPPKPVPSRVRIFLFIWSGCSDSRPAAGEESQTYP